MAIQRELPSRMHRLKFFDDGVKLIHKDGRSFGSAREVNLHRIDGVSHSLIMP